MIIPLVLLVVLIVLILLLRSLVAPLMLMATVVLSLLAALGFSAEVYTHVFGFAGTDAALPLYTFVFLVALGIDYNIFLMSQGPGGSHGGRERGWGALLRAGRHGRRDHLGRRSCWPGPSRC